MLIRSEFKEYANGYGRDRVLFYGSPALRDTPAKAPLRSGAAVLAVLPHGDRMGPLPTRRRLFANVPENARHDTERISAQGLQDMFIGGVL